MDKSDASVGASRLLTPSGYPDGHVLWHLYGEHSLLDLSSPVLISENQTS